LAFDFVRLSSSGSPHDLLESARIIGPLGFCEAHRAPFSGAHKCREELIEDAASYGTVWESEAVWRSVSATFNCVLRIGAALVQGLSVDPVDLALLERKCSEWRGFVPDADRPGLVERRPPPSWPWDVVGFFLNYFSVYGSAGRVHVGSEKSLDGGRHFALSFSAGDAQGVIALGIGTILASERGSLVCQECHDQFPRSGRAKYCMRCRRLGLGKAARRRARRGEKARAQLVPASSPNSVSDYGMA
jgi:hypothetical protein